MVEIPDEAIKMFNNPECGKDKPLIWLATVGVMEKEGDPHLAPVCFTKVKNKKTLLVAINFAAKTMYNIETYSKVAVGVAVHYKGFMVKGTGAIVKKGSEFDEVEEMVKARFGDKIKPQAALTIDVEEVYSLEPKPGVKRIV